MDGGLSHCTRGGDQTHSQEKERQKKKAKWLSEEALQIAVKRREVKGKGEWRVQENSKKILESLLK